MKIFSSYGVFDVVNDSDKDDSIHRDEMSKIDRGNVSNQQRMRQSRKFIFMSEERFERDNSPINSRGNGNGSDSSYAAERGKTI